MEHEKIIYEYCVLRYVPDIERQEFVNIGLLMMCKRYKWLESKIEISTDRIKHLGASPNADFLKKQSMIFLRKDVPARDIPVEEKYRWLSAVKSAIIQTSASHPGIIILNTSENLEKANINHVEKRENIISLLETKFDELFKKLVL